METTREIIAENISVLRKAAKLTQAELAEKLNYSDKAVSKWERGESIPDVIVLAELATLFSVTVDYFLHAHQEDEKKPVIEADKKRTRLAIALTSCVSPYAVSVLLFFIFNEVYSSPGWLWKLFILPLPIVSGLSIVFSSIWSHNKLFVLASVSALLWTILLSIYVFVFHVSSSWLLFVIGAPLQIIILFWTHVVHKKRHQ